MKVLVADTSVLIDLHRARLEEAVFSLPFELVVPDVLYEQELAPHPELARLVSLGLRVEGLDGEAVDEAVRCRLDRPRLSVPDAFAYVLARRGGWILLSGDGALRDLALMAGVEVHGVLWVMDRLEEEKVRSARVLGASLRTLKEHPRCRLPRDEVQRRLRRWTRSDEP